MQNHWSSRERIKEKQLRLKFLLVMDIASAHPQNVDDDLLGGLDFINVKFLPPNMTPLLQSMDQQIISNFKQLYTRALLQNCF